MARQNEIINIDRLGKAVAERLDLMKKDVRDGVDQAAKVAADHGKKVLQKTSPVGRSRKSYSKGWQIKRDMPDTELETDKFTIYNKSKPWLGHLLEHPHKMVSRKKVFIGMSTARPHVEPARKEVEEIFIKGIENLKL